MIYNFIRLPNYLIFNRSLGFRWILSDFSAFRRIPTYYKPKCYICKLIRKSLSIKYRTYVFAIISSSCDPFLMNFSLLCKSHRGSHFGSLYIFLGRFYAKLFLSEAPLTIVTQYLLIRNDLQLFYHVTFCAFFELIFHPSPYRYFMRFDSSIGNFIIHLSIH